MRRDKDVKVYTNCLAIFARDATAATKRPARFVTKKTRAAVAVLTLLSSPAIAGPPYITDDPEPVDYQRWEFYAFSQGGRANGETSGVAPSCDCNYGVLPDVQLHIQPGAAFRRASGASPAWGPGDTELGLKYRFVTRQDERHALHRLLPAAGGADGRSDARARRRTNPRPAAVLGPKGFWRLVDFRRRRLLDQSRPRRQKQLVRRLGLAAQAHERLRSAWSCPTICRPKSAAFSSPASTSARTIISANTFTCSPRPARAFSTRGNRRLHRYIACKSPASSS